MSTELGGALPPTDDAGEPPPISLRIVVDGASTAGKTTTARALGERLGRPVVTPEEAAGRTLLFDWMDHVGGRSDGRAIRTQVVAVPGHLPHLRARLLVTADVVLFVADTSASGIGDTRAALAQVRELLQVMPEPRPGLLVQANKRDRPDALPLDQVRSVLALDDEELLIETVATEGDGVRQSFVYAVRLGLQHVRAVAGPRVADRQLTAEALLAELDTDPHPVAEPLVPPPAPTAIAEQEPTGGPEPDGPALAARSVELEPVLGPEPVRGPEADGLALVDGVVGWEPGVGPDAGGRALVDGVVELEPALVAEPDRLRSDIEGAEAGAVADPADAVLAAAQDAGPVRSPIAASVRRMVPAQPPWRRRRERP